ncbi:hypothetical protein F0562_013779 [Nyssa sinensis]|uniref:MADS-box domain-containing protein n=1 Tax=Nyssa sinensis TaxID=561372 RepID=A0A5J4ZL09_9ASTE|nr:hypothetical protein F0562_013779 [Nyssa sinensis]
MGSPKLEIKKIEKISKLQVTFLKGQVGLFNKAAQLSAICGILVAVLVMSPAKKVYAFGNLSTDSVIDRFLAGNSSPTQSSPPQDSRRVLHSSMKYLEAVGKLETEKNQGGDLLGGCHEFTRLLDDAFAI